MSKSILVLNAGSSSIKFAIFRAPLNSADDLAPVLKGHVAQGGEQVELRVQDAKGKLLTQVFTGSAVSTQKSGFDHEAAMEQLLARTPRQDLA